MPCSIPVPTGPIDLVAAAGKSGLSVSIKDYGKGIAPELLDHDF